MSKGRRLHFLPRLEVDYDRAPKKKIMRGTLSIGQQTLSHEPNECCIIIAWRSDNAPLVQNKDVRRFFLHLLFSFDPLFIHSHSFNKAGSLTVTTTFEDRLFSPLLIPHHTFLKRKHDRRRDRGV